MEGSEVKKLVCIVCPLGCALEVKRTESGVTVTGNTCKRGEAYGIAEVTAPTRTVTSSVRLYAGEIVRAPVKTAAPIPKDRIFAALYQIKHCELYAPVHIGDVAIHDVAGTGVDVVVTRDIARAQAEEA